VEFRHPLYAQKRNWGAIGWVASVNWN